MNDATTIYLMIAAGGLALVGIIGAFIWAWKNEQFDEDIKWLVFTEADKDKMSPEDYKKSREVLAAQIASRERHQASQYPRSKVVV